MSYTQEMYQYVKDYRKSWVNWACGKMSMCHKCGERRNTVMRIETGEFQCIPCVVKFNEIGVLENRYTFICLICGYYYYEFIAGNSLNPQGLKIPGNSSNPQELKISENKVRCEPEGNPDNSSNPTAMLHCQTCRSIDTMIKKAEIRK